MQSLQRKCGCNGTCGDCSKEKLRRQALAPAREGQSAPAIVHEVLRSPGQPLERGVRSFFEQRFGHEFSRVRVHTDERAAASAAAVNARAYTVGSSIVFGSGTYAPGSREGRQLLAHELTHVTQQQDASTAGDLKISNAAEDAEHAAGDTAARIDRGEQAARISSTPRVTARMVQRAPLHSGRILNEGTCEHLACDSRWSQCNAEGGGIACPAGSAAVQHHPTCTSQHFNVLFACEGRTGGTNTIAAGCRNTDRVITKPHDPWNPARQCGQDLVVCANGASAHGTLWDRSNRNAWEVTPQLLTDLGVSGDIRNGAIYGSETAAGFSTDPRCRPATRATGTGATSRPQQSAASED